MGLEPMAINPSTIWLMLFAMFLVAEVLTAGLVSIWFCAGSLIAMFVARAGAPMYIQVVVFILVSAVLFVCTRPFAKHVLKMKNEPTNLDRIIGETVYVTEDIDNINETGAIKHDGKVWTARSTDSSVVFKSGELVKVVRIEGVKVLVKNKE